MKGLRFTNVNFYSFPNTLHALKLNISFHWFNILDEWMDECMNGWICAVVRYENVFFLSSLQS